MKTRILLVAGALLAVSCAPKIDNVKPPVVGGSRADGVVKVSFAVTPNTKVDWAYAKQQAKESCSEWGYQDARKFGGELRLCVLNAGLFVSNCTLWRVDAEYQCLGDLEQ